MTAPSGTPPTAFPLIGGRACLNLVATLGHRHATPVERLPDPPALARWLVEAGLLPVPPPVTVDQLRAVHELREAIHRSIRHATANRPGAHDDIALLNEVAARPDLAPQLVQHPSGPRLRPVASEPTDAALSALARDAVLLLAGPHLTRIKVCEHPDCSLLFLDDTQAGRRRWCSMSRCGNLVKINRYRTQRSSGR